MTATEGPATDRKALRVLVVGGASRAARSFRCHAATSPDLEIVSLVRRDTDAFDRETMIKVTDYFSPPDAVLQAADAVVNFVGLTKGIDEQALKAVNVDGPARLAATAKRLGVAHFVQLSSFHVYGYAEDISAATPPAPQTLYARSKLAADEALLPLADAAFAVTAFRLPILYGKGVGENLTRLASLMARAPLFPVLRQVPLRSGMHIDNLAVLVEAVLLQRAGGIRFGADPEPYTIEMLADVIGEASGKRPNLLHLPAAAFFPLRVVSQGFYSRLCRRNLVQQGDCVRPEGALPVPVRIALRDVLPF